MNANEQLSEYNHVDNYHKTHTGLLISYGVIALTNKFGCHWFLDIISTYYLKISEKSRFQIWTLTKHEDDSATVICSDGIERVLKTKKIPSTDFNATEAVVWVEDGIAKLPSEYK